MAISTDAKRVKKYPNIKAGDWIVPERAGFCRVTAVTDGDKGREVHWTREFTGAMKRSRKGRTGSSPIGNVKLITAEEIEQHKMDVVNLCNGLINEIKRGQAQK